MREIMALLDRTVAFLLTADEGQLVVEYLSALLVR